MYHNYENIIEKLKTGTAYLFSPELKSREDGIYLFCSRNGSLIYLRISVSNREIRAYKSFSEWNSETLKHYFPVLAPDSLKTCTNGFPEIIVGFENATATLQALKLETEQHRLIPLSKDSYLAYHPFIGHFRFGIAGKFYIRKLNDRDYTELISAIFFNKTGQTLPYNQLWAELVEPFLSKLSNDIQQLKNSEVGIFSSHDSIGKENTCLVHKYGFWFQIPLNLGKIEFSALWNPYKFLIPEATICESLLRDLYFPLAGRSKLFFSNLNKNFSRAASELGANMSKSKNAVLEEAVYRIKSGKKLFYEDAGKFCTIFFRRNEFWIKIVHDKEEQTIPSTETEIRLIIRSNPYFGLKNND